ncbi:MAG TPA: zinc-ribbon domain containing protein [Oscillospiraceae bacterium]|nr:zinc-ribbon domain containing protein [Oscillospiraceae bacterium]
MYEDKTLTCRECQEEFIFTVGEQEFYAEKGFENEPARCPSCRAARKQRMNGDRSERRMYKVTCSECGVETEVPFNPSLDRPVYCRDCFQKNKSF